MRLQKQFNAGPGKVSVIFQCFNCLNDANQTGPFPTSTWGNAQTPVSTFGATTITNTTRTYQAALRYDF